MKSTAITIATLGLLLSSSPAVPPYINYQSVVTDSTGTGLGDAAPINRKILFRIYDAPTAGNKVWAEEQTVTISKGEFSVLLGNGIAAPSPDNTLHGDLIAVFAAENRYIGITVDNGDGTLNASDAEITPRARITSTAFAFRAKTADSIASGSSLQLVGSGATGGLGYYDSATPFGGINIGGPVLYGASGGALGSVNGATQTIALRWDASGIISGKGSGLSNLNANSLSSGTVADDRLSPNVALRADGNSFSGTQVMSGQLQVGSAITNANTRGLEVNGGMMVRTQNVNGGSTSGWNYPAFCIRRSDGNRQPASMISLGFRDDPWANIGIDATASISIYEANAANNASALTTSDKVDMRINSPGSMTLNSKHLQVFGGGEQSVSVHGSSDLSMELRASGVGEVYYEIATSSTGANSWKIGTNDDANLHFGYGGVGSMNYTEKMSILSNGYVGIGRYPTANKLEIEGNASKTTSGSWLANSDQRIKTDITTVKSALETLEKVRLVEFHYTKDYLERHPTIEDRSYLNVIAQEFREVFPRHVKSSEEKMADGSEILQVDTHPLTIYTAAAVQELNTRLKTTEARISVLEQQLAEQAKDLAALKAADEVRAKQLTQLQARESARDAQLAAITKALSSGDRPAARTVSLKRENGAE